ncbi:MAG: hypothetical protein F2550_03500, partial [Actinobacteria bacterium]|nr:hypothetical protein [Actinomycetota bacterium]
MPGENLTRAEAQERKKKIDDLRYEIFLDLTNDEKTFHSNTRVFFKSPLPGSSTFIDAIT